MSSIFIIAQKEFLSRIQKKTYKIMTVFGPFMMLLLSVVPVGVNMDTSKKLEMVVLDNEGVVNNAFSNDILSVHYFTDSTTEFKAYKEASDIYLYSQQEGDFEVVSSSYLSVNMKEYLIKVIENEFLKDQNLHLNGAMPNVGFSYRKAEKPVNEYIVSLALFMGILIYFFIFMYGIQLMRAVSEEKNSRVVEVMLQSVRPFQLLSGKIIGVGMAGVLQMVIWSVVSGLAGYFLYQKFGLSRFSSEQINQTLMNVQDSQQVFEVHNVMVIFEKVPFVAIVGLFVCYFVTGYLIYGALLAAVGACVEPDTDTQHLLLPVTLPLLFSFLMYESILSHPHSDLSIALSLFPLTAPVSMMLRLPFEVPLWQILLSLAIQILSVTVFLKLSGRIYRTAILIYGKKISYREIIRWLGKSGN